MDFKEELQRKSEDLSRAIEGFLPKEEGYQKTILKACNYSVKNGGKRLRPLLMLSAYELCCSGLKESGNSDLSIEKTKAVGWTRKDQDILLPFMAAIEMIHSSSLVHDDLPCMDNDTLRRGKKSTWAKFGEDMGTLAGDGLMILAFEAALKSVAPADRKLSALEILAHKTGIYGMIGGQTVDVELTGKRPGEDELEFIFAYKTAALFEASLMIGAVLAEAPEDIVKRMEGAGHSLGMAFQIRDDILDVTASDEDLGKKTGIDASLGKVTWVSFYGLKKATEYVKYYTEEALRVIGNIGDNPFLTRLISYLAGRSS